MVSHEKRSLTPEVHIPINELNFQHLHWRENDDGTITSELDIEVEGQLFELVATQVITEDPTTRTYTFHFMYGETECLQGSIALTEESPETGSSLECSIAKLKGSKISGRLIYDRLLEFLQTVVDQSGQPANHTAHYSPRFNIDRTSRNMSAKQWKEIFEPILLEHDYKKTGDTQWEKTYQPKLETYTALRTVA